MNRWNERYEFINYEDWKRGVITPVMFVKGSGTIELDYLSDAKGRASFEWCATEEPPHGTLLARYLWTDSEGDHVANLGAWVQAFTSFTTRTVYENGVEATLYEGTCECIPYATSIIETLLGGPRTMWATGNVYNDLILAWADGAITDFDPSFFTAADRAKTWGTSIVIEGGTNYLTASNAAAARMGLSSMVPGSDGRATWYRATGRPTHTFGGGGVPVVNERGVDSGGERVSVVKMFSPVHVGTDHPSGTRVEVVDMTIRGHGGGVSKQHYEEYEDGTSSSQLVPIAVAKLRDMAAAYSTVEVEHAWEDGIWIGHQATVTGREEYSGTITAMSLSMTAGAPTTTRVREVSPVNWYAVFVNGTLQGDYHV